MYFRVTIFFPRSLPHEHDEELIISKAVPCIICALNAEIPEHLESKTIATNGWLKTKEIKVVKGPSYPGKGGEFQQFCSE
jgi:hypothetical protein